MTNRVDETEGPGEKHGEDEARTAGARKKAPRPSRCGSFTRARLAEKLPELVHMLLLEAGAGSLAHLKAVLQLVDLDQNKAAAGRRKQSKNLEQVLVEQWAQDRLQQDRLEQERPEQERAGAEPARQNSRQTADTEAG